MNFCCTVAFIACLVLQPFMIKVYMETWPYAVSSSKTELPMIWIIHQLSCSFYSRQHCSSTDFQVHFCSKFCWKLLTKQALALLATCLSKAAKCADRSAACCCQADCCCACGSCGSDSWSELLGPSLTSRLQSKPNLDLVDLPLPRTTVH